jgi:hypothetical protein
MFKRLIIAAIIGALCGAPVRANLLLTGAGGIGGSGPTAAQVSNFLTQSYTGSCTTFAGCYTFSRAGNAMVYDSTGKLTYGPNNLLLYSNTYSNTTYWPISGGYQSNVSISGNNLIFSGAGYFVGTNLTINVGNVMLCAQLSSTTLAKVAIRDAWNNNYTTITLTATPTWYCTVGVSTGFSSIEISNEPAQGASGTAGTVTVGNMVMALVTYETAPRPGDQVITTSAAYYGPRFDYPNATAAGLLLEPVAATNIVKYSNDLTNAAWTKGATITVAETQTGVDGVANAATLVTGGAVSATNTVLQSITLASSTRKQSAYVKGVTVTGAINMTTDGGTTWVALSSSNCFNPAGVGTAPATGQAVWLRCSFSQATVTNPNVGFQVVNLNDAVAVQYVDNETGTYATSAIPTTSASVTRAAESLTSTPSALGWSDTTGTLIVEGTFPPVNQLGVIANVQGASLELELQESNAANNAAGQYEGAYASSSTNWVYDSTTNLPAGSPVRAGVQIISGTDYLSANGNALITGSTVGSLSSTSINFGQRNGGTNQLAQLHLRSLGVYNTAMSSVAFQARTTVGASY